jgi:anti-sigma factor ChrR (cupin superfamily)
MTQAGELSCEEVARVIHAYAFGRLTAHEASVGKHLSECPSCGSLLNEIRRDTADLLQASGLADLPEGLIDLVIVAAAAASEPPVAGTSVMALPQAREGAGPPR